MALAETLRSSAPQSGSLQARRAAFARLLSTSAFRATAIAMAIFVFTAAVVVGCLFWQTNVLLTAQTLRGLAQDRAAFEDIARDGGLAAVQRAVEARSGSIIAGHQLLLLENAGLGLRVGNLAQWPSELAEKPQGGAFRHGNGMPAVGLPLRLPDGTRLLVARDLQDQRAYIDQMRWMFLAAFAVLAAIGLIGGLVASRLVLIRVALITDTGAEIMAGDLSRRIPLSGADDEFDHLAQHLNAMLARIEQLMTAMREVSDNIAHDLKTPLNRLRIRAETALRAPCVDSAHIDGLGQVIEDADAIIQTFNALLLIARLEAGAVETSAETFDLAALMGDVAELYEPVSEEAGQRLTLAVPRPVVIRANRQLISQALANLIDNAIKYGRPTVDGMGEITVGLTLADGRVRITVGDRGPGIALADHERVRQRFVRLDQSRTQPGTGLGLSLVAAVARLHGGELILEDNAPGLRVSLVLPQEIATGGQLSP